MRLAGLNALPLMLDFSINGIINRQIILTNIIIIPYVLSRMERKIPYNGKKYTQELYVEVLLMG